MHLHTHRDNLQILYEDNHLIAINKRPGDIVQGDRTGDKPLSEIVKSYIAEKYNKPGAVYLGVVHRLDRPTSGIVVFAKTSKALSRLNRMFAERETLKKYWAIVKNPPSRPEDTLVHYLKKNSKQNKSYATPETERGSKKAVLHYKHIKALDRYHLLEIDLETGRHHQIRVQLAAVGSPVKGDLKYGFDRSNPDGGIHLHARELKFIHPVRREEMILTAPPPADPVWDACL